MLLALYRKIRWPAVLLGLYWLTLFVATHLPVSTGELLAAGRDKPAHLIAYAGLAVLLAWTLFPRRAITWAGALYVVTCVVLYGALDEYLQRFVPGRVPDVTDWLADAVGGVLGTAAFAFAQRLLKVPLRSSIQPAAREP